MPVSVTGSASLLLVLAFAMSGSAQEKPQPGSGQRQDDPVQSKDRESQPAVDRPPPGLDKDGKIILPPKNELFRAESDASFLERIRQQKAANKDPFEFPAEEPIKTALTPRSFPPATAIQFPSYVVYQPTYFQQINAERYGWELGVFQPLISTAQFYGDVLLLPYKVSAQPPSCCDSNVGYIQSGDPESLRFLTMPFSWRGVIGQTGAAVGGAALFP